MPERLDKFLANQNIGSRKDVGILIRKGNVAVNGEIVKKTDTHIIPEKDEVTVNGEIVGYRRHTYIMMNKPKGVLSASDDKRESTVVDIVPAEIRRRGLFPAGRLDRNTTGLLIITDDGEMAHRMLAPKSHVFKVYEAVLDGPVTEEDRAAFAAGVKCGSRNFLPAELWLEDKNDPCRAMVKIREGKFHQVKRMFFECGKTVLELKRLSIGSLKLDPDLQEGECRIMTDEEVHSVFLEK